MKVACCQIAPTVGAEEHNRRLARDAIRAAVDAGARLVVLPELCTSGYAFASQDEARSVARRASGGALDEWSEEARRADAVVVGGFAELGEDGRIYDAAAVVDADGVLATYRKANLWGRERELFAAGRDNGPCVIDTRAGKVGVAICYDLFFPELMRALALAGAEIVAVPTCSPLVEANGDIGVSVARATAHVSRVFVAVCDRTGDERGTRWTGRSVIVDADGRVVAGPPGDRVETLLADCDLADARRKTYPGTTNNVFGDRYESKRVMYEPPAPTHAPRFTGPRTYARLPRSDDLADVDCAIFGMPWDGSTSFRPGARFGPESIRSASGMIRTFNPAQRVQVFGTGTGERIEGVLSCVDYGDAPTVPGYVEETLQRIERFVADIVAAGVVPLGMGGDHSVTLAVLRALAARTGPLGVVHLDAHGDLRPDTLGMPYSHGTWFRRAAEEGIVDPARFIQAGIRGPLYSADELDLQQEAAVGLIRWLELCELTPDEFAARVRERVGSGPTYFTFDVDFVDAACLPGTGTPEIAGPTPHEALQFVRALREIDFVGFDVVEVSPPYDGPGQMTALFASHVLFEMLSLVALAR